MPPVHNPFSVPPELECFWLTRPEEPTDKPGRSQSQGTGQRRVWEKATASSRFQSISRLRDEDLPMAPLPLALQTELSTAKTRALEEERPDDFFLTSIATKPAVGLAEPLRAKEADLRSYVTKKREVFLAHMACDVKKAEVVRLEEKVALKEEALAKSQKMLEQDAKRFEEFLQDRLERAAEANSSAETAAKRRQDRLQRLRQTKRSIDGVQAEIVKFCEVREECARYKAFIQRLTPSEWREKQQKLKQERKAKRREAWIAAQLAPVLKALDDEEQQQERRALEEATGGTPLDPKRRGRGHKASPPSSKTQKEEDEEALQREKERSLRRRRLQRRREDEERRVVASYVEESSGEEHDLFFTDPKQLLDSLTQLERKNLQLIQTSQHTEQLLDDLQHNFERSQKDLFERVRQSKSNIKQLEKSIEQEKRRGDDLRKAFLEQAGTQQQDRKLEDLTQKVYEVYARCGLSADSSPDPLTMLALIESKIEELIQVLDDADPELVLRLEWGKERERRERLKHVRRKEIADKQEERLRNSWLRSQAPIFRKTGKPMMFKAPPTSVEKKTVIDTTDEEAHAAEHRLFGVYIDRKTQLPETEPPVFPQPLRKSASLPYLPVSESSGLAEKLLHSSSIG